MQYLVLAPQADGAWVLQVFDEANKTLHPIDSQFSYSNIYRINDVDYVDEYTFNGSTRVLFINTYAGIQNSGNISYYMIGQVIPHAPEVGIVCHNVHLDAIYVPSIINNWLSGANAICWYVLDFYQWEALYVELMRQQSQAYQESLNEAIKHTQNANLVLRQQMLINEQNNTKLKKVLYKVEDLESKLKNNKQTKDKSKLQRKSHEDNRKKSVEYAIAQFNVYNAYNPPKYENIYILFKDLGIKTGEQGLVIEKLAIDLKQCAYWIMSFADKNIHPSVKACFLKKFATFPDQDHIDYLASNLDNAPKIIKALQTTITNDPQKILLIQKYRSLQAQAAKDYDEKVLKPQRNLEKAVKDLDFDSYYALVATNPSLKPKAAALFVKELSTYNRNSYDYLVHQASQQTAPSNFYTALRKFIVDLKLKFDAESYTAIHSPEVKLASLYQLPTLTDEEYYNLNKSEDFLKTFDELCDKLKITDIELKNILDQMQLRSVQWQETKFQEIIATLSGTNHEILNLEWLCKFAKRTNSNQQNIAMLAVKHGCSATTLKAIFAATGDGLSAKDDQGRTVLHYLALYYHGDDFTILKLCKLENLLEAQESHNADTYLHCLLRHRKENFISKFLQAFEDNSSACFLSNNKGETIITLIDNMDVEPLKLREVLHKQLSRNLSKICIEALHWNIFCPPHHQARLFALAKKEPLRLLSILDSYSIFIDQHVQFFNLNPQLRSSFESDISTLKLNGQSLHWHLTEGLIAHDYLSRCKNYFKSYLYRHRSTNFNDNLVSKLMVRFLEEESESPTILDTIGTTFSELNRCIKNDLAYIPDFIQAVIKHKAIGALCNALRRLDVPEAKNRLLSEIEIRLFTSENLAIVEGVLPHITSHDQIHLLGSLTKYYLGSINQENELPGFIPEYQALSQLVITCRLAHEEIMLKINEYLNPKNILDFIINIHALQLNYLLCFLIKNFTGHYLSIMAMFLNSTCKTDQDYKLIKLCISSLANDQKHQGVFMLEIVASAVEAGNYFLLEQIYRDFKILLTESALINIATICKKNPARIGFILIRYISDISSEDVSSQESLLYSLYSKLKSLGLGQEKTLIEVMNDHNSNSKTPIAKKMIDDLQILDTVSKLDKFTKKKRFVMQ